ncbi:MAG: hypothetical protein ABIO96_08570 [Nitrospiraceae bacterium]
MTPSTTQRTVGDLPGWNYGDLRERRNCRGDPQGNGQYWWSRQVKARA